MSDPNDVVPEGTPPEIVAALSLVEKYARQVTELRDKIAAREAALTEAIEREERGALLAEGGDAMGGQIYADEMNQRRDIETSLARARAALKAAGAALHQAKIEFHHLTHAGKVARFTRITNERARRAAELQSASEAYSRALTGFLASTQKIANAFGATGAREFGAMLLRGPDLERFVPYAVITARHDQLRVQYGLTGSLAEMIEASNRVIIEAIGAPPKEEIEP